MEITTYPLNLEQFNKLIPFVFSFFDHFDHLKIMYGWECNTEKQYEYFQLPSKDLESFLSESIEENIYKPGDSDLYLKENELFEFLFCHEFDIHLKTKDRNLLNKFKAELNRMNIEFTLVEKGKL